MRLKIGDKVAVVAPSDCIQPGSADKGIAWLRQQGFSPVLSEHLYIDERYSNQTKKNIAHEINQFFADDEIKALFCTRGGAGSLRILNELNFAVIRNHPKPIFGFSDSTVLQNALWALSRNVSFSGLLLNYDFCGDTINPVVEQDIKNILSGQAYTIKSGKKLRSGSAEGILLGGNLSALSRLFGTKYFPDLTDKILVLEDCGEKTYKIDSLLSGLKMQPSFDKLAGIILGQFSDCVITDAYDGTIEQILEQFLEDIKIPVIGDFLYGHIKDHHILPIGARISMNADTCEVKIPSSADM